MQQSNSTIQKAIKQFKFGALIEIVNRTLSPVITIILARLLAPEVFGLVSTTAICISFTQMFWDAGLSKAVIQTNEPMRNAANVVFWVNLTLGIVVYALVFICAPIIANFFNNALLISLLRVTGLQIILSSLTSVQKSVCIREFKFKKLLMINISTSFVPGVISIPMALSGHGVWSLVVGSLTGQILSTVIFWTFSTWKPQLEFDKKVASKLFSFGVWVQIESFGAWLMLYLDSIIVGRTLGMDELGVYRTGWTMVTVLFGVVLSPALQLILPAFARIQSDHDEFIRIFKKSTKLNMFITMPLGLGLFFCGNEIAQIFFGTKWCGLGFVLQMIGLAQSISWLTGINADVYKAIGKPKINTFLIFGQLLLYIPVYFIMSQYGLRIFVISRTILTCLGALVNIYVCHRSLELPFMYIFHTGKQIISASIGMFSILLIVSTIVQPELMLLSPLNCLLIKFIFGSVSFLTMLYFIDRRFILDTSQLLKRSIS